ncbi:hypothetical protein JVT61DRAFT_3699 [Boletus reticuloceps]|uniref:Uncharacterized protein n=1 Tax=Boletus reticuloceps TaxID=495285 RepID=A0A8I2YLV6_9AGAM|nr:hypothetical protein JVT61DRAFT_3699 [Boletus reticuloceps]
MLAEEADEVPLLLIAVDQLWKKPGETWPDWKKILDCTPRQLANHPWSSLPPRIDQQFMTEEENISAEMCTMEKIYLRLDEENTEEKPKEHADKIEVNQTSLPAQHLPTVIIKCQKPLTFKLPPLGPTALLQTNKYARATKESEVVVTTPPFSRPALPRVSESQTPSTSPLPRPSPLDVLPDADHNPPGSLFPSDPPLLCSDISDPAHHGDKQLIQRGKYDALAQAYQMLSGRQVDLENNYCAVMEEHRVLSEDHAAMNSRIDELQKEFTALRDAIGVRLHN